MKQTLTCWQVYGTWVYLDNINTTLHISLASRAEIEKFPFVAPVRGHVHIVLLLEVYKDVVILVLIPFPEGPHEGPVENLIVSISILRGPVEDVDPPLPPWEGLL